MSSENSSSSFIANFACICKPLIISLLVSSIFTSVVLTAFVVWANTELQHFVSRFSCQVFRREMGVSAIGVCVSMAKQQCEKVTVIISKLCCTLFDCQVHEINFLWHHRKVWSHLALIYISQYLCTLYKDNVWQVLNIHLNNYMVKRPRFLKPPGKIKIGLRNREFQEASVYSTVDVFFNFWY